MSTEGSEQVTSCSPTYLLSRYVAGAEYAQVPSEVVEAAKAHLLDSIGCIIGGTRLEPARTVMEFFAELGGMKEATVFGTSTRLPTPHAAYVNAYLNNALDFDDSYLRLGHPGSAVIPSALAVAERVGASGCDLLHAVILGYEVSLRIGAAIMPTPTRYKQVWGLSTWQIFGAIAAAARLLALNVEQTRHAFGLGGVNAPVPFIQKFGHEKNERPYSWAKNNYGWSSMGAIVACLMARRGFMGNRSILDGEHGFWIMAGSDRCDFPVMTTGLGEEYLLPKTGFKPYACCRWTHTALDAIRSLRLQSAIDPAAIERIDVHTFSELVEKFGGTRPASIIDAQFHLPYVLALECLDRSPRLGLSERDLNDPAVLALMEKVTLHLEPEADRGFYDSFLIPARVVVTMKDWSRIEACAEIPRGAPGGPPFAREDLHAKFYALVEPVIGPERAWQLETVIWHLDKHTIADLVRYAGPSNSMSRV